MVEVTTTEPEVDGRVLRGQRNREAIVDALLELYGQGQIRPTAAMVADKAGLSTRSVYHHFDDMKSLILEVSARNATKWQQATSPPPADAPLADRIAGFAQHRFTRWTISAPVVRAGLLAEQRSKTVSRIMKNGRIDDIEQIRLTFADVMADAADADQLAAALDVAYDFHTWDRLHSWSGLDEAATVTVMVQMATAVIEAR